MKVLIVDDSRVMRLVLRRQLSELGFETDEAGDGQKALDLLGASPVLPDLVTVDWNMPVMDGLELVRRIRGDSRLKTIPILMLTTEAEYGRIAEALEEGANEYLMKPFEPQALAAKLGLMGLNPDKESLA